MKPFTSVFLAGLVACHAICAKEPDTLPPLKDGRAPQNFVEMWAGFDPRAEPLEVEVLKEWEEDGVALRVVRFRIGVFKGQKARLAAIYGFPKAATEKGLKFPGLVQIHGGGQYADYRACLMNAKRGYATVSLAWAGRINAPGYRVTPNEVKLFWEGKTNDPNYKLTTDWGAVDGYHAPGRNPGNVFPSAKAAPWTLDPVESPRNSGWFLCALAARRALTFLEQQPEVDPQRLGVYGHSMGGKLTVMAAVDPRVKAAAPSCGGISDRYNDSPLFRATIGDDVSLRQLSCPIIFLSPANDFHGRIGDLPKAIAEVRTDQWRVVCSPHHNHQDTAEYEVATLLWFDQHLKGAFTFPKTPDTKLELRTTDGVPTFTVRPDWSRPVLAVDVFYTQQGKPDERPEDRERTKHRFWHHAEATEADGVWSAQLPLSNVEKPLWVYANVTYPLDEPVSGAGYYYSPYTATNFVVSSLLQTAAPDELKAAGVRATLKPTLLIESFEGDWEKEWFTYKPEDWPRTTHKVHDEVWKAPPQAQLALQVRAEEPNTLVVRIDDYAAEVALAGGDQWQDIILSPSAFRNFAGEALPDWNDIKRLTLGYAERLRPAGRGQGGSRTVGKPWHGGKPPYRHLRWIPAGTDNHACTIGSPDELIRRSSRSYTFMWWAHGWRGRKVRCVQTSAYGMALDIEQVRITHFGPISASVPYEEAVRQGNGSVFDLPAAELQLAVEVGGIRYTCQQGSHPRLIESGRFLQRSDLKVQFAREDGATLPADCRFEIVAWPERLSFILFIKPRQNLKAARAVVRFNGEEVSTPKADWQAGEVRTVTWVAFETERARPQHEVSLKAWSLPDNKALRVGYDSARGWHQVAVPPVRPFVRDKASLQRIRLRIANPSEAPAVLRVNFAAEGNVPGITGLVPLLRDTDGNPLPIPVQISKNWHRKKGQPLLYQGPWLHAITRLWLPARFEEELEFCIARNFWGTVPLASHAQLCLIGWGGDQLWDQAAIGSWGESVCYDPDVGLNRSIIDDMRPLMVTAKGTRNGKWNWSNNVGGGDFLVYFDQHNRKQFLTRMRTAYLSQGPNLTDVIYSGISADGRIAAALRVMTPRCDDLNRAYHHFRYDVLKPVRFTRLAFYQVGADRYNDHQFRQLARGNEAGLIEEWSAVWGGRKYHRRDIPCPGAHPWFSLHEGISKDQQGGAWANRGLVVRSWKARLAGKDCPPFAASYGTENHYPSCNLELVPPSDITELQPGDFVEATVELLVLPQFAQDYYGPNHALRVDLEKHGNTWRPVYRQARDGALDITVLKGALVQSCPVVIQIGPDQTAEFTVLGGVGYTPVTFTGLSDYKGWTLEQLVGGAWRAVDQSVFGRDFWQVTSTADGLFTMTFNVLLDAYAGEQRWRFARAQ